MKKFTYLPIFCALFTGQALAESKWGIGLGAIIEDEGYLDVGSVNRHA